MGKKYRSDPLAAVRETALGLTEAGVMDKRTMKAFDEMCLEHVRFVAQQACLVCDRKPPGTVNIFLIKYSGG
jgi:hypothetical protein